ncbi:MAG: DUF6398 domain-containing protein [Planctomycetota bacterium]|jgi:hypothetical protein
MQEMIEHIPEEFHQIFREIVGLTDAFCRAHLDGDYQELCRDMAFVLCLEDSPLGRGKAASWASGIVHALGWVNFLQDSSTDPYMPFSEIAKAFGVSQGTMTAKSKIIRDGLGLIPLHPDWCTPAMIENNPLVWLVEVNGLPMDMRTAPLAIQQAAYDEGLIPFVPEPNDEPELPSGSEAKTLKFPGSADKAGGAAPPKKPSHNGPPLF